MLFPKGLKVQIGTCNRLATGHTQGWSGQWPPSSSWGSSLPSTRGRRKMRWCVYLYWYPCLYLYLYLYLHLYLYLYLYLYLKYEYVMGILTRWPAGAVGSAGWPAPAPAMASWQSPPIVEYRYSRIYVQQNIQQNIGIVEYIEYRYCKIQCRFAGSGSCSGWHQYDRYSKIQQNIDIVRCSRIYCRIRHPGILHQLQNIQQNILQNIVGYIVECSRIQQARLGHLHILDQLQNIGIYSRIQIQ